MSNGLIVFIVSVLFVFGGMAVLMAVVEVLAVLFEILTGTRR
jgi:hypothetical protein